MESSGRIIQCNCLTWLSLIGCVTQSVCAREKSAAAFLFVSSLWLLVLLHSQFHKINPSMIFPYNKQSNSYGRIETLHHTDVFVFKRQEGISPARTVTPPTAPDVTFRFGHLLHNSGSSGESEHRLLLDINIFKWKKSLKGHADGTTVCCTWRNISTYFTLERRTHGRFSHLHTLGGRCASFHSLILKQCFKEFGSLFQNLDSIFMVLFR